ncbi:MAG: UDP-3-O-acylglucosamine N-acyltransferase [Verrucomicrobia subdivision 3 bacterium]|nr:UDP-3-O-acylglucosamine N-acyltransferase [Limisphaerales bacterium]MCS1413430.1 UDP-3-O-acylglucosamine N-acyltransferase [Limisphaerales bacterium]
MRLTTGDIASRLGGSLVGDSELVITGVAAATEAQNGQITFAENDEHLKAALGGNASAVLVVRPDVSSPKALIHVANVRVGFAYLLELFHPEESAPPGIHPSAVVDSSARVDATALIGPGCIIERDVVVSAGAVLCGGNHVGAGCQIGAESKLFPNVVLYAGTVLGQRVRIQAGTVVGADGYGYVFDGAKHRKIPQVGSVVLEDDVELGANVTIDRGALGQTVIGEGTKIDNLVQIAHNVVIGKHCIVVAQTGIAGSTTIGDSTVIAGQVGIAGHLKIGSKVAIAAQSGVMRDIPDGQKVFGSPSQGDREMKRQLLAIQQLPDLMKRFRQLEKKLGVQVGAGESGEGPLRSKT